MDAQVDLEPIKNLSYSIHYAVEVDGINKPVFESTESLQTRGWTIEQANGIEKISFVNFDVAESGSTTVKVILTPSIQSFEIRPFALSETIGSQIKGDTLILILQSHELFTIRFNDSWENVLCIFANPAHTPPLSDEVTYYFKADTVHDFYTGFPDIDPSDPQSDIQEKTEVEAITLNSNESLYLEEGAVLRARIEVAKNAENVKIYGRGVMAYGLGHVENFGAIEADGARYTNLEIEGITICDAPGWILRMFSPYQFKIRNFKTVGSWHFNTDGIQFAGEKGDIFNCFLQCNDDNFSMPSYIRDVDIQDVVLWNIFNGGAINFGWGNPNADGMTIEDITIIRSGDCCSVAASKPEIERRKAPISMISYGGEKLQNITFRNIVMEEIIQQGEWIHFIAHQEGDGFVKNLLFEDVQVLSTNKVWGLFKGSNEGSINNITFNNLTINGSPIGRAKQAGLKLQNADSTSIRFFHDSLSSYSAPHQESQALYQVYPNPSKGWIQIESSGPISGALSCAIYDISGSLILSKDFGNQQEWDAIRWDLNTENRTLSPALYILQINTLQESSVQSPFRKILIQ